MRQRGPRVEIRDGRACLVAEGEVVRKLPPPPGAAKNDAGTSPFFARDTGPEARLEALDRDGVWAEVMYPNLAFFCTFAIEDAELQAATCRVYNDWVAETFASCERLAPVGLVPIRDLGAAVAELEHLEGLGLRSALLPTHADYRPYNDPAYEPLWEAAEGLDLPLGFHAGTGRAQTPARGPGAAVVNYVVTVSGPMETVAYLCAAGVLERHPGLRVGMVECGAGWLAWTLEAMDDAYREHHAWLRPVLPDLPSAYFRRQGFVTFQRDPVGLANVERTGSRCLLWGSDYPHPEGTFPDSRRVLDEQLRGVPQEVVERVVLRNAAELYRIPLPADA
jgi:predicted TIM-barrel fold metal-dependent hydrolase